MLKKNLISSLILFSIATIPSFAFDQVTEEDRIKLRASLTSSYLLRPGDELSIEDRTLNDLNNSSKEDYDILIEGDGTVTLPLPSGDQENILLAGLTIEEAKEEIRKTYGKYLKHPLVFLKIEKRAPIKVFISGAVSVPGIYKLQDNDDREGGMGPTELATTFSAGNVIGFPLFEVLQLVGGLDPRADISHISITRGNAQNRKVVNLKDLVEGKASYIDYNLLTGDTVYVPETDSSEDQAQNNIKLLGWLAYQKVPVTVVGNVNMTGNFVLDNDSTILDAIGNAGGTDEVGTLKKVKISRLNDDGKYYTETLNVHDLIHTGATKDALRLRPGDRIEIVASGSKAVRHFLNENSAALINSFVGPVTNGISNYVVQKELRSVPIQTIQILSE